MPRRTPLKKRLAYNLYQKRLRQNLSQQRVADRVGISRESYNRYESGNRFPRAEVLDKLGIALRVDPATFFTELKTR